MRRPSSVLDLYGVLRPEEALFAVIFSLFAVATPIVVFRFEPLLFFFKTHSQHGIYRCLEHFFFAFFLLFIMVSSLILPFF